MHEYDSIRASQRHRKHSSVMVRLADSKASDLGSILGHFIFIEFIYWDENYEELEYPA